jgi:hypothetical protein
MLQALQPLLPYSVAVLPQLSQAVRVAGCKYRSQVSCLYSLCHARPCEHEQIPTQRFARSHRARCHQVHICVVSEAHQLVLLEAGSGQPTSGVAHLSLSIAVLLALQLAHCKPSPR